jgi:hypothetical protein
VTPATTATVAVGTENASLPDRGSRLSRVTGTAASPAKSIQTSRDNSDHHDKNGYDNRIAKWEIIQQDSTDHGQEAEKKDPQYNGEYPLPRSEIVSVFCDIIVLLIGVGHL